ncbi:hypothetical protein BCR33DRAFT_850430 [Rhizoclosmatium globosum]|uniref:Rab3 GTPase-activating protein catalytic subunit n=1 Tax=Rhizoclosmatium globosum TaxID=329046 RepID=A0A1Y2CD48_9FUNG|nr:hypothetical protein BCR33DRAFT_850430 [Rhizoclosmatium globosum]|eukprot:ORY44952.1 hypothetical protein BCR33DRAFT_850430 [Rhizoclosmatium globosum]
MEEEGDTDEVFEIVDFSVAGIVERLVGGIEVVSQSASGSFEVDSDVALAHSKTVAQSVVVVARAKDDKSRIDSDAARRLSGAANVALRSCEQEVPVLIHSGNAWRNLYNGLMISPPHNLPLNDPLLKVYSPPVTSTDPIDSLLQRYALDTSTVHTRFRMIHSPFVPSENADLHGLARLFYSRLLYSSAGLTSMNFNPTATATFSYSLSFPPDGESGYYYHSWNSFSDIPIGPSMDPVASVQLECRFDEVACQPSLDGLKRLDSLDSTDWKLVVGARSEGLAQHGRLFLTMSSLLDAWVMNATAPTPEFNDIQTERLYPEPPNPSSPTDPPLQIPQQIEISNRSAVFSLGKTLVKSSIKRLAAAASTTIHDAVAVTAATTTTLDPFTTLPPNLFMNNLSTSTSSKEPSLRTINALARAKYPLSAPYNSLLWRLCTHIITATPSLQLNTITRHWAVFTRTLRGKWDAGDREGWVSEVMQGGRSVVDLRDSLLVQKLCMLAYCMDRRSRQGSYGRKSGEHEGWKDVGSPFMESNTLSKGRQGIRNGAGESVEEESLLSLGSRFLSAMGVGDPALHQQIQAPLTGIPIASRRNHQTGGGDAVPGGLYGQSWNSEASWEDFGLSAGAHQRGSRGKEEEVVVEDLSTTEYYHPDSISSEDDAQGDMFFDSLDFPSDLPKGPNYRRTPSQSPNRAANSIHPTLSHRQVNEAGQQASSLASNSSSGIVVVKQTSSSLPKASPANVGGHFPSALGATDSFIKLPLDVLLLPPESEVGDRFYVRELNDPEAVVGALHAHQGGLKLLMTGEVMMVPEVQESGCMTEDMIDERENLLLALGDSKEAADVRARMQTAGLKSDMESFKAANPHAILEDFVRWHSPRDWIVDESAVPFGGKLSSRMSEPGNLWHEVWAMAKRVPAAWQKPLFDCEKEAEKCLMYFEDLGRNAKELLGQLFPTFIYLSYDCITSNPLSTQIPTIAKLLPDFSSQITQMPWTSHEVLDVRLSEYLTLLNRIEYEISVAQSLLYKLPMQLQLVDRVISCMDGYLECEECDEEVVVGPKNVQWSGCVKGMTERKALCDLLIDEGLYLDVPSKQEFVIQALVPYPNSSATVLPQKMCALLKDGEFRVLESVAYDE